MKTFLQRCIFFGLVASSGLLQAQDTKEESKPYAIEGRKGSLQLGWGYNRACFTKSDLHLAGNGYDFTLYDIEALDRPAGWELKVHLNPGDMTIPQFEGEISYFIKDNLSLTLGFDHMKYVMKQDMQVKMDGYIDASVSSKYAGTYSQQMVTTYSDFLSFEHTDGLNYIHVEMDSYKALWQNKNKSNTLEFFWGGGLGIILPRSDVRVFGVGLNNKPHFAGFGSSVELGFRYNFLKNRCFFQISGKTGYIYLHDILTTGIENERAKQHFGFASPSYLFGGCIPLKKK